MPCDEGRADQQGKDNWLIYHCPLCAIFEDVCRVGSHPSASLDICVLITPPTWLYLIYAFNIVFRQHLICHCVNAAPLLHLGASIAQAKGEVKVERSSDTNAGSNHCHWTRVSPLCGAFTSVNFDEVRTWTIILLAHYFCKDRKSQTVF